MGIISYINLKVIVIIIKMLSYNPFKMFVPYIGAFLGVGYKMVRCPINQCGLPLEWMGQPSFSGMIVGFLIGWAIEGFIRHSMNNS